MPNGAIIIINTRYHYDDLCGWLLKQEAAVEENMYPWDVISIPAWLNEEAAELLGLPVGTSYFPEWKPDELLKIDEQEIRASNGSRYWNALYMQDPSPDDGGIIKKKWIQTWDYDEPPPCDFILQTYDTAFSTSRTADYSVIQTWGIFYTFEDNEYGVEQSQSNIILLGNTRGRFEYPELRRKAQELYAEFRPDVCIIEKKASGQSLLQDMRRAGLPVLDYLPDRDKVSRVYAATPMMEAGRVWLPSDRVWSDDLFSECMSFPHGSHDDQVDCMTMAIHYMKDSWNLIHPEDPSWEDEPRMRKRVAYWRT
jgi:predicted phage terminase large subunit-like protein